MMPRGPIRQVMPKGGVVFRIKQGVKNIGYGKGPVQNKGGRFGPGKQQGGLGSQQGGIGPGQQ